LYIFASPFNAEGESVPVKMDSTLLSERILVVGPGIEESESERYCWRRYWRRRA
jgi:hypothetical protein